MFPFSILQQARDIQLLALDVDGVFTNGGLHFSNTGEETKVFDVQDGLGVKLLQKAGIHVIVITGRTSPLVQERMASLGITTIIQGREDKGLALREVCSKLDISLGYCAYMGDDWPDLSALRICALPLAVPNARREVKNIAHYITNASGGHGAIREICDLLLTASGKYDEILDTFYSAGE